MKSKGGVRGIYPGCFRFAPSGTSFRPRLGEQALRSLDSSDQHRSDMRQSEKRETAGIRS